MAVTSAASGTQTAVVGTEHTLHDTSGPGTYQLVVDCVNMAQGDVLELRVYEMVLTGGTRHVADYQAYFDTAPVDDTVKRFYPVSTDLSDSGALRFTLKQRNGTARNFDWKVRKFA